MQTRVATCSAEPAPFRLRPIGRSPQPVAGRPLAARPVTAGVEAALITRVANRDQQALGELFDRTRTWVFGLALRIVRNHADAEEVLLDVYAQVWRMADRYDPTLGSAWVWLGSIARSRALDKLRRRRARCVELEDELHAACELPGDDPDPEQRSIAADAGHQVRTALRSLPAPQREAIELAYYADLTQNEIAEHLGQPLGTVKTRIRNGLIRLRREVGEPRCVFSLCPAGTTRPSR